MWIGAGAAAVATIIVVAVAFSGGGGGDETKDAKPRVSASGQPAAPSAAAASDTSAAPEQPAKTAREGATPPNADGKGKVAAATARGGDDRGDIEGDPESDPIDPALTTPDDTAANEPVVAAAPPVTKPQVRPRAAPTLGGKRVVLEYDTGPAAPRGAAKVPAKQKIVGVAKDDTAAVGAARITYFSANRRLYAGDADGAIRLYRQALGMYPGYVAGYRGLGLAYAQKGDRANALRAFRTYIGAVPNAKDVPLVRKRIAALQRAKR